jgi:hypothetical protein
MLVVRTRQLTINVYRRANNDQKAGIYSNRRTALQLRMHLVAIEVAGLNGVMQKHL